MAIFGEIKKGLLQEKFLGSLDLAKNKFFPGELWSVKLFLGRTMDALAKMKKMDPDEEWLPEVGWEYAVGLASELKKLLENEDEYGCYGKGYYIPNS